MLYLKNSLVNLTIILLSFFFITVSLANTEGFIFPKKKIILIKTVDKKNIKIEKNNGNNQEYLPQINSNEKISFITLNFTGSGENKLEIVGTTYLSGLTEIYPDLPDPDISPILEYDYDLIYVLILIIVLIIAGIVGIIILTIKRRRK